MACYRDVMHSRREADSLRADLSRFALMFEHGNRPDNALGVLLGLEALCLELRALGTTLDYAFGQHTNATRRV